MSLDCPRCTTKVRNFLGFDCNACYSKSCEKGLQLTLGQTCKIESEKFQYGKCDRLVASDWRICPDCKCELSQSSSAPFTDDLTREHRSINLMCTICPSFRLPKYFVCSPECFSTTTKTKTMFHHFQIPTECQGSTIPYKCWVESMLACFDSVYPEWSGQMGLEKLEKMKDLYRNQGHVRLDQLISSEEASAWLPWVAFTAKRRQG